MTFAAVLELFGGMRAFVFACLLAVALVFAGVQTYRVSSWQTEAAGNSAKVTLLEDAAERNLATIIELEQANKTLADGVKANKDASERAIKELEAETDRLADQLQKERKAREKIYKGDANAAQWAASPIPSAVYNRLRDMQAGNQDAGR